MISKLQNHITQNFSFLKGKKILLAVSGGLDSMVLMHLFHQLNYDIAVAHCNFQLRGDESNDDESFVKLETQKLQIPFFVNQFDTKQFSEKNK